MEIEAESTAPLSKTDETLLVNFANDFAAQAARLDDLAKQLITLCIAVPSVYAAVLKLVAGSKAVMPRMDLTCFAMVAWLLALGLSLASLLPERHEIDPDSLTEIRNYFSESARRKYLFLCCACIFSFLGITLAIFSIF
ncbi:MAG: hypothetical protein GY737_19950 [Desulfobacteraceae bacterium]|nr:hypothetical protein [Desulfobacteraceae bacterium]